MTLLLIKKKKPGKRGNSTINTKLPKYIKARVTNIQRVFTDFLHGRQLVCQKWLKYTCLYPTYQIKCV